MIPLVYSLKNQTKSNIHVSENERCNSFKNTTKYNILKDVSFEYCLDELGFVFRLEKKVKHYSLGMFLQL